MRRRKRGHMPFKPKHANALVLTATRDVAAAARSVANMAQEAEACAKAGQRDEAVQTLFDIEPLLHDARKFLELALFVNRKVKDSRSDRR